MDDKDIVQQIEPVRRTFLNVLLDNLKAAERENYVHRLIYVGEHTFNEETNTSIAEFMTRTVQTVNDQYHDELLTGIFVYYPRYFCHAIEGSEDSIIKHLLLLTGEKESKNLTRMKALVCYHHINQRFLQTWVTVTGKPPTLLERIDVNIDITRASRHIYHCVQKLYTLADYQRPKLSAQVDSATSVVSTNRAESSIAPSPPQRTSTSTSVVIERYLDCLPEYGLIDFLLSTPYTADLQNYINLYGVVPPLDAYKDKVWPVPTEFVPFHIFDKPVDPVTDLPTAVPEADAFKDIE